MIYIPECVKQINLNIVSNCSDYLNKTKNQTQIEYEIKSSWQFSLVNSTSPNEYEIETLNVSEVGYMLLYSFDFGGGQISIDTTSGARPDYNITNGYLNGYLSINNPNYRFSVIVKLEPVQKFFRFNLYKTYTYPGIYRINSFLQGIISGSMKIIVSDGDFILNLYLRLIFMFNSFICFRAIYLRNHM
jgi:hypothetical protein